jgi:hypothetical protein
VEPIATKEIAQAVMGVSSALASILLVFVGFLVARAESMPPEAEDRIVQRYRRTAKWGLLPVGGCTLVMLASYAWLFAPESAALFYVWSGGFWVVSLGFLIYALVAVIRM